MTYRVPGPLIPEWVWGVLLTLLLIAGTWALVFFSTQWASSRSCAEIQAQTGTPTRFTYGIGGQCFVKVGGRWIPASTWREVAP